MGMNDLDSAKCQKSREGTHWELNELLMIMRQNNNSAHLLLHFGDKTTVARPNVQKVGFLEF